MHSHLTSKGIWLGMLLGVLALPWIAGAADKAAMKTVEEKASYLIGTMYATDVMQKTEAINLDLFIQGIREILTGGECVFSPEEQQAIMQEFGTKERAKMEAKAAAQKAQEVEAIGDSAWKTKLKKPEVMTFDKGKDYFWILETNKGTITIKLMPDIAPMHVTSTLFLTNKGFYNDMTFHRVIPGFMAQGGCPLGTGTGGPGYKYAGEFDKNVKHDRPYLLSMANAGPGTDGSQFFLTFVSTPHLDGKHTIFGEIVEGKDVMNMLEAAGTPRGTPKEKLVIEKARIEEKPKG